MNRRGFLLGTLTSLIAGSLLLTGCGGGSGGGGGGDEGASPATRTVALKSGQSWQYTGTFTRRDGQGGESAGNLAIAARCEATTFAETPALLLDYSIQNLTTSAVIPSRQIVTQGDGEADGQGGDDKRAIILHALNDASLSKATPILPGKWETGHTFSGSITTSAGTETFLLTIVGAQRINIASRIYDVWNCRIEKQSPTLETFGEWKYAPELGTFVQADYTEFEKTTGNNPGFEMDYHLRLSQSNI